MNMRATIPLSAASAAAARAPADRAAETATYTLDTRKSDYLAWILIFMSAVATGYGYSTRNLDRFVPYEETGYYLGIIGGSLMLAQVIYSIVKRSRRFGKPSLSRLLFEIHMVCGFIGPVLILYHSNFSWGAKNSNVALITMLLVVASGLVGRIVYGEFLAAHLETSHEATVRLEQARQLITAIEADVGGSNGAIQRLLSRFSIEPFLDEGQRRRHFWQALVIPFRVRIAQSQMRGFVRKLIHENAKTQGWSKVERKEHHAAAHKHVREFLTSYRRASQYAFWSRVFALWHAVHLPLFFLLLISGITHVVAVHWY
jgi:hypothetical protein